MAVESNEATTEKAGLAERVYVRLTDRLFQTLEAEALQRSAKETSPELTATQLKFVASFAEDIINAKRQGRYIPTSRPERIFGQEVKLKQGSRLDKFFEYLNFSTAPEPDADKLPHSHDEERELSRLALSNKNGPQLMRHHLAHDIQERVKNLYPGDDSETIVARTILGASIYYSTCDDPINVGSFSRGVGIINIKTPEMREGDYDQIWDAQYPDAILATLHRFGMGGEAARLASPAQILSKALPQDFGIK